MDTKDMTQDELDKLLADAHGAGQESVLAELAKERSAVQHLTACLASMADSRDKERAAREAAWRETGKLRDGITAALGIIWPNNVCPDDVKLIAAVKAEREITRGLRSALETAEELARKCSSELADLAHPEFGHIWEIQRQADEANKALKIERAARSTAWNEAVAASMVAGVNAVCSLESNCNDPLCEGIRVKSAILDLKREDHHFCPICGEDLPDHTPMCGAALAPKDAVTSTIDDLVERMQTNESKAAARALMTTEFGGEDE